MITSKVQNEALAPLLLVEDDVDHAVATIRTFKKAHLANPIVHCADGDEAIAFLQSCCSNDTNKQETPGLILLDLNMPGTDGHQVLAEIKQDPILKVIPVVILTTSNNDSDIRMCYREGANSYIQKPVDLSGLMHAIQCLKEYWLDIALLPQRRLF